MTTQQNITIQRIHDAHAAERFAADQAAREQAALTGELGIDAQLIALSALALELRAAGHEATYQAIRTLAYELYEGSK